MEALRVEVVRRLEPAQVKEVTGVVDAATDADGVRPLNEHVMLHLRYGGDVEARHVLGLAGERIVAYGHLDVTDPIEGASAEVVVHPDFRSRGLGRRVVERMLAETSDGRLRLWAHGEHPAAARMAAALGFAKVRSLWQMRRSLFAPLPVPQLPDGIVVRTFVPGQDDRAWLELNARAFAGHPEQGDWSLDDLHRRRQEPWFDPAGFFLAERGGRLVGFHWTKVHGGNGKGGHGHEAIGEVYVVGVDPDEQGGGLGKALVLVGLRHLRSLGLPQVMLYVEADNQPAIRVYSSLGFTHWDTDTMYARWRDSAVAGG